MECLGDGRRFEGSCVFRLESRMGCDPGIEDEPEPEADVFFATQWIKE
jgi:hypothetical protein